MWFVVIVVVVVAAKSFSIHVLEVLLERQTLAGYIGSQARYGGVEQTDGATTGFVYQRLIPGSNLTDTNAMKRYKTRRAI